MVPLQCAWKRANFLIVFATIYPYHFLAVFTVFVAQQYYQENTEFAYGNEESCKGNCRGRVTLASFGERRKKSLILINFLLFSKY